MSCGDPHCFACPECVDGYEPPIEPIRGVPVLHGIRRQLEELDALMRRERLNSLGIPRELVDPDPIDPVASTSLEDGVHELMHDVSRKLTDPVCADLRMPHERRP